jgi:predicted dehydrogenase
MDCTGEGDSDYSLPVLDYDKRGFNRNYNGRDVSRPYTGGYMQATQKVRIGVIGAGTMGTDHIQYISALHNTELAAVCDTNAELVNQVAAQYNVPAFTDYQAMLEMPGLDAILIVTPHYSHPPMTLAAFAKGIHVLVEKPIAVHVKDAQTMIDAYHETRKKYPNLVFGAVFMQRTYGHWVKIKDLIDKGDLGHLMRTTWIISDWFRTQAYYDSGSWRATWKGEGGGIVINQAAHNLDLYQWMVGMPKRVSGFVGFGKYHHIEVDDEVTGYFEHENGMIGHFITSTAESPGTNRLEIVGENGKLIFEDGKITFYRNRYSLHKQIVESDKTSERVENWKIDVPYSPNKPGHRYIIENFADAILYGVELIAPAIEGINSLSLTNAMLLSADQQRMIELPLDGDAYVDMLKRFIEKSTVAQGQKNNV